MPKKKFNVALSSEEEVFLRSITHTGNGYSAREILHAQVLLHSNDNQPSFKKDNRELAEWFGISPTTVNQIRKSYSKDGLEAALYRKTRITPPVASKITDDFEAKVIATALAPPPEGYSRWTPRLLAEYCMEKQYIVSISHTKIGELLNSNELKPHLSKYWCIPKQNDSSFVANMEDILGIYQLPYCKENPVICMDENRFSFLGKYVKEFLPVPFIWIRTPNCLNRVIVKRLTPNMFDVELQVFLCLQNHLENGGTYQLFPGVRKVIMPK